MRPSMRPGRTVGLPAGALFPLVWLVVGLLAAPSALALGAATGRANPASIGSRGHPAAGSRARAAATGSHLQRVPPLRPPVAGPVVRGYEAPAGPYGAGHRGVDLAAATGAPVGAPAAGRVVFAGGVAGTVWASIEVAPGVVTTLGPLRALAVTSGRRVAAGARLADLAPGHGSGRHPTTLHLGLRIDGAYVDPLPWLTGYGRPRLAPLLEPGGPH